MFDFFSSNGAVILLVAAGLCLLAIVMMQAFQVSRLNQRINQITGGVEGGDLEEILGHHLETVHQVGRDMDELTARTAILESSARHHFTRQGLVRFNPFPDTGGNQSFALALLDESDDGFIVSSLHSRTGTRIYAKAVTGGKADTNLSSEEEDAIDEARAKRAARPMTPARSAAASRQAASSASVDTPPAPVQKAVPVASKPAPAAPKASPALAPKPAPGPAVPAPKPVAAVAPPAKAPVPAPVAAASVAAPAPVDPAHELAERPASQRAKGQEKAKGDARLEDVAVLADERVDRKPGRPPVAGSGQR